MRHSRVRDVRDVRGSLHHSQCPLTVPCELHAGSAWDIPHIPHIPQPLCRGIPCYRSYSVPWVEVTCLPAVVIHHLAKPSYIREGSKVAEMQPFHDAEMQGQRSDTASPTS